MYISKIVPSLVRVNRRILPTLRSDLVSLARVSWEWNKWSPLRLYSRPVVNRYNCIAFARSICSQARLASSVRTLVLIGTGISSLDVDVTGSMFRTWPLMTRLTNTEFFVFDLRMLDLPWANLTSLKVVGCTNVPAAMDKIKNMMSFACKECKDVFESAVVAEKITLVVGSWEERELSCESASLLRAIDWSRVTDLAVERLWDAAGLNQFVWPENLVRLSTTLSIGEYCPDGRDPVLITFSERKSSHPAVALPLYRLQDARPGQYQFVGELPVHLSVSLAPNHCLDTTRR